MTPHAFIAKWRAAPKDEHRDAQPHFIDLCRLLQVDDPVTADPEREWFTFEKGATRTTGGRGWADVWRRECFGWEYKSHRRNLDDALRQLQTYAFALENPPLLIVSDMETIRVHTNWTNTVQEVHTFGFDDLVDAGIRDKLRACFLNPESLRPRRTRQALTEEAAGRFAALATALRDRGHPPGPVAHFVNRLVFCMFAEDVGLLPDRLFLQMLEAALPDPASFASHARTLFAAMETGGLVGFTRVDWFNGGLFDDDDALPLLHDDIQTLLAAARLDWSQIDPSILGTLFERGLDPDKRSQLGAHYTDRDKITKIIRPVIVEPLLAEWSETKASIETLLGRERTARSPSAATRYHNEARELRAGFLERLRRFRVLDPACGSGNFLYLALQALKNIEHTVNVDTEVLGFTRDTPATGPENVHGIEINPYAAELARVSVWIGEIQWMRAHGFEAARHPILRPLDTIECRDALLNPDGNRADWPDSDVVVGNPPFLGGKLLRHGLGGHYVDTLFRAWRGRVRPEADLVTYWIARCGEALREGRLARFGLVTTNSIRGGANRAVLQDAVAGSRISHAWDDEEWTINGADVRVSLICVDSGGKASPRLDGEAVEEIYPDLTARRLGSDAVDLTEAARLRENLGVAFMGDSKGGAFDVSGDLARDWLRLPLNPNGRPNADVLRPWVNGMDLTRRHSDKWIIDFGWTMSETDASLYEAPFHHVLHAVKPGRMSNSRAQYKRFWWRHVEPRQGMWRALRSCPRYIATVRHSRHRIFKFFTRAVVPDSALIVVARDDHTTFGILHSRFHELWTLRMCSWIGVGNDPRYTPSTCFETFPFPPGLTPNVPALSSADGLRGQAIAEAAAQLDGLREAWLNPPDLVRRTPEVVPGYPDRLLSVDEAAARTLRTRTLTNLYNQRPAWLDSAHHRLDEAVADAYGWGDDWRAGKLGDDEIIARLFRLNQERAQAHAQQSLT